LGTPLFSTGPDARAEMNSANIPTVDIDPFSRGFLEDPYASHHALRDAGPLVWLPAIEAFAMARYAEVKAALADYQTYCSGRGVGLSDFSKETPFRPASLLLETDPPLHDRTRDLMNKIVSLSALRTRRECWQSVANSLLSKLLEKRAFDAVSELSEAFPMQVFPETIGLQLQGREHLLTYATNVFNAFGPRNSIFDEGQRGAEEATQWVMEACRRKNLLPGGWGMAVFEAADRGECSEAEAERLVRSFLSAGVDTTVNGIAHMLLAFATFPETFSQVQRNQALARTVFDESLRWDGTVQTFFRTSTRDVAVAGHTIPEGSKVLLFLAAANRDPRYWTDPERFDPARRNAGHVGFGFGIHQCLGQMVARQEAEVVLGALLAKVGSIRLVGPVTRRLNNTLHALHSLPVEVTPL
jgi:4-methoxybenzoate monooxygenase (O-demethylating)